MGKEANEAEDMAIEAEDTAIEAEDTARAAVGNAGDIMSLYSGL